MDPAARYFLIGGFAVILHGGERTTKDIVLLVDPSPDNITRLKSALSILEDNAAGEIEPDDLERYRLVRVADEVMVDLLRAACGDLGRGPGLRAKDRHRRHAGAVRGQANAHPHQADGAAFGCRRSRVARSAPRRIRVTQT